MPYSGPFERQHSLVQDTAPGDPWLARPPVNASPQLWGCDQVIYLPGLSSLMCAMRIVMATTSLDYSEG